MNFVMDSSAIVPILHEEEETENAVKLIEMCLEKGIQLAISPLVLYEVGNCIIQFSKRESRDGKEYLRKFLDMDLKVIEINDDILLSTCDLAREHDLTFYDAVHAEISAFEDSILITLDGKLLSSIDRSLDLNGAIEYLETLDPQ